MHNCRIAFLHKLRSSLRLRGLDLKMTPDVINNSAANVYCYVYFYENMLKYASVIA